MKFPFDAYPAVHNILGPMNALRYIRKHVFQVTQTEFAVLAGVGQASVSRWENDGTVPSLDEMQAIRDAAAARGLQWDDRWFFEEPRLEPGAASAA